MDIQQTNALLVKANNEDNITYFNKHITLYNLQPTTQLKEFFDTINSNTVTWLKSLPKEARSINTLRKYKRALISLLENNEIQSALGAEYCENVKKHINNTFSEIGNQVAKERSNKKAIIVDDIASCTGTETSNNESLGIPIDKLEVTKDVQQKDNETRQDNIDIHYEKQYEIINKKYNQLQYKHENLLEQYNKLMIEYNTINVKYTTYHEVISKENDFLHEIVKNLTAK
jgi:hypothetical protein